MMRMMVSGEQGSGQAPESMGNMSLQNKTEGDLNFSKMLERFYLSQFPKDPNDPLVIPPANLKDRKQD